MYRFSKQIHEYCEIHTSPLPEILSELERETHLKTLSPQMLSGRLQGQLLAFFSKIMAPKAILEIGTFTGYSAICLAQGLAENGVLHTIEVNPELEYLIRKYIDKAGLQAQIQLHIGRAQEVVPALKQQSFDLVFIDAAKQDYALFYDLVIDKIKPGGLLLADNILWDGKVLTPEQDHDAAVLHAFNCKVEADPRVEQLLLPVRDGLLVARKRAG
ncbi:MAG: O-methyltransferase [Saprospiraceae bacterium]|nr:O-methyltransferase [Saprospiraceae bacterium]